MTNEQQNEWANAFLNGRMDLQSFEWLGGYIEDKLVTLGVPAATAREAGEKLQVDIAGLFEARALAEWGVKEVARLDERDRLRAEGLA
jgi:hypothetical protein